MKVVVALLAASMLAAPAAIHDVRDPCDGVIVGECWSMLSLERSITFTAGWDPAAIEDAMTAMGFPDTVTTFQSVTATAGEHLTATALPGAFAWTLEIVYEARLPYHADQAALADAAERGERVLDILVEGFVEELTADTQAAAAVTSTTTSHEEAEGERWFAWQEGPDDRDRA